MKLPSELFSNRPLVLASCAVALEIAKEKHSTLLEKPSPCASLEVSRKKKIGETLHVVVQVNLWTFTSKLQKIVSENQPGKHYHIRKTLRCGYRT